MKPLTYTVEVPARIAAFVERRCDAIIRHYLIVDGLDLRALAQSLYLQGLDDGCIVGEKLARNELALNAKGKEEAMQEEKPGAQSAPQKPSIGRIVVYNHPGSADGRYPPTQSPAIIQNVADDGTVRLFVFGPKGQHMDDGLKQGDGPCQWNWPPRV